MEQNKEPKVAIIGSGSTGTNAMLHAALASLDAADVVVVDEPTRAYTDTYFKLEQSGMIKMAKEHGLFAPRHPPRKREQPKISRNAPCPCGSGLKYKRCCAAPK